MIDYSNVSAICFDCAMKAGLTPKYKAACMWVSECGICHKQKPCTDLWHDWDPPKTEIAELHNMIKELTDALHPFREWFGNQKLIDRAKEMVGLEEIGGAE